MNLIQRLEQYGDTHHPKWLSVVRIIVGLVLLFKGFYFLSNREALVSLFQHSELGVWGQLVAPFIGPTHIVGGVLITLGLITRISSAFNIPILIGAVIFVNLPQGFDSGGELALSVLILLLLMFFFVYGSGHYSVDKYLTTHKDR